LQIDAGKMSKSSGDFLRLQTLIDQNNRSDCISFLVLVRALSQSDEF